MEERNVLNPEVLENIKSFSGTPDEMSARERILTGGNALQRIQTAYTTALAVQKPRSISRVVKNVLEEAKLAGSAFYYRWEVKNRKTGKTSTVQGASIDLAMCVARNYGNCAIDVGCEETASHYMMKGIFIDLETGFTCPRLFRQRKNQNIGGGFEADRAEDIVFQIAQSKAVRNAIVKAAPAWLVDQAIDEARQAEISRIKPENIVYAQAKVIDFFEKHGIDQDRIEAKLNRQANRWTAEDIADLRGSATALNEGRISPEELFPLVKDKEEKPAQKSREPKASTKEESTQAETTPHQAPIPAQEEQIPGQAASKPEEGANVSPEEDFRSQWINLRGPGFSTYVWSKNNIPLFESAPEEIRKVAREKWRKLYRNAPIPPQLGKDSPQPEPGPAEEGPPPYGDRHGFLESMEQFREMNPGVFTRILAAKTVKRPGEPYWQSGEDVPDAYMPVVYEAMAEEFTRLKLS